MNLDAVTRPDAAAELAADDDGSGFDLSLDPGALTDDQRIGRVDFPAEHSANPDSALKAELAFELTSLIKNAGNGEVGNGYFKI